MSLRLLISRCSSWWDHISTRKAAAVRRVRVAKEICSFIQEGGVVASPLKPYSPGARLVPSTCHGEEAERAAWGAGHLGPPAGPSAPRQVPGVLDVRPAAAWALPQGGGQPVGWAAAGSTRAITSPCRGGSRCPGSSVHAQAPRVEAEGGGSKEPALLLPRAAPAWCAWALRRESWPSLGRAGRWGPDGFPPAPGWSPTRAAAARGGPACRCQAHGGLVWGRPSLLVPVPQARGSL